jgi:hypothetical protein
MLTVIIASNRTRSGANASSTTQQPSPAQQEEKPAEQVYKNIQIMKGVPASRLMPAMTRLTQFLGVDCVHCHVPDAFDKDDKPAKQTARKMFQMVRTINTTLNTNRVTCYTCHHARAKPASPPSEWAPTEEEMRKANEDQRPAEEVYKNLQTLKGVLPAGRLMMVMGMFTKSLGVDCNHCHVPGEFEKDDKPAKATARRMLRLTGVIAREYYNGQSPVNCYTCHRGQLQPDSMPPPSSNPPATTLIPSPEIKPADPRVSVDAILDNYIQALGGKTALEKVKTRMMKGNLVTQGGMSAPLEVFEKAPNKTFTTFRTPNGVTIMGFDGAIGWTQAPEVGLRELKGDELNFRKFEAEFYKDLKIKERYPRIKLLGVADLGDRHAYAVETSSAEGKVETWYFDAQSSLLVRIDAILEQPGKKTTLHTFLEDYREVAGVKLPFSIRRARPGFTWTYQFDEIIFNVPVDDARFNKPGTQ